MTQFDIIGKSMIAPKPKDINVLIACEESQAECNAFLALGFNAYSCDIQPCLPKGNPSRHIMQDVSPLLDNSQTIFYTLDGQRHQVSKWHLIIAHPPCTYLCKAGSIHMWKDGQIVPQRLAKMYEAREFFYKCLNAKADYLAVENPIPMKRAQLPPPSCFIHPSWFGVKYTKKTLYWLKKLPPLMAQIEYPEPKQFVRASRGKYRSRTFPQVAKAIAEQWGSWILSEEGGERIITFK